MAVDSDAGYVFVREGGTTKVIALANGQMVRRLDWGGPMVLDAQGRRLYIDSSAEPAALIIVDTRSLDQVGKIPLPPRDDSPSPDDPDARWGEPRVAPVLLPQRGTVLIFRAGKALEYDPTTGASGSLELSPLEETPHALRQALGSPDGRTLYVAKHAFDEPIYDVNTQLAAIDVESGRTLWNRPVFGKLTFLFASEAGLLTSSDWGRGDGSNLYVWNRDGLALRSEGWPTRIHSAFHDREAGQIILVIDQFIEQDLLAILDDTTLSLRYVTPAPTNAMLVASDSPHDRWLLDTGERAVVVDDAALLHLPETSESPQAAEEGSHGLVAVSPSWPDDDTIVRATVLPGAARCFDTWRARDLALSSDLGRTWRSIHSGLPTCHRQIDHAPVLAPGFGHDRRMYLGVAGLGIFRFSLSDPIWRPVNDGLRALGIGDFVLSPHFDIDPTMIAFSADRGLPIDAFATESEPQLATTWISRNAGDQWSELGRFDAVAFSESPSTPYRLYGFREGSRALEVSDDMGATWSVKGGSPWPSDEALGRHRVVSAFVIHSGSSPDEVLFVRIAERPDPYFEGADVEGRTLRSVDGGETWLPIDTVLPESEASRLRLEDDAGQPVLLWTGRIWVEAARRNFLHIWRSDDLGASWYEVRPPSSLLPMRDVSALADGDVLITTEDDRLHVLPLDDLGAVPVESD